MGRRRERKRGAHARENFDSSESVSGDAERAREFIKDIMWEEIRAEGSLGGVRADRVNDDVRYSRQGVRDAEVSTFISEMVNVGISSKGNVGKKTFYV